MSATRPPRPDLQHGDKVLVVACRWVSTPAGRAWLPHGGFRWRVVDRVVWDGWCGWQVMSTPTAGHHPSRESAAAVVAVLRAGGERRPTPPAPRPEQIGLWEVPA